MHFLFVQTDSNLPIQTYTEIIYYCFLSISLLFTLNRRYNLKISLPFAFLFSYLSCFHRHFDYYPPFINYAPLIFIALYAIIFFKDKLLNKFIAIFTSYIELVLMDILTYCFVAFILGDKNNYLQNPLLIPVSIFISISFSIIHIYAWNKITKRNIGINLNNAMFFPILVLCEILLILTLTISYNKVWNYMPKSFAKTAIMTFIFISLILIVINVLVAVFIKNRTKFQRLEAENTILEYQNNLQLKYYEKIQENIDATSKTRHDINNLIQIINLQIAENTEESRARATEIAKQIEKNMESTRIQKFCDNRIINTVLFDKTAKANKTGIKICDDVMLNENTKVDILDLCRIFVNLLDNSINATAVYNGKENKTVFISCRENNGYLYIKTENPFNESNTKSSKGYGLKIIEDIANKYNGSVFLNHETNRFKVLVTLKT